MSVGDVGDLAYQESWNSGLPGIDFGPGDAYRHTLAAAELTRRYGEGVARAVLCGRGLMGRLYNSSAAEDMDSANDELGISIGRTATSWNQVVTESRAKIMPYNPNGEFGNATFLPRDDWRDYDPNRNSNNWPPRWDNVPITLPPDGSPPPDGNVNDPITGQPPWYWAESGECVSKDPPNEAHDDFDEAEEEEEEDESRRDPIVLDLDNDGIKTVKINAGTRFDHDGDGFREQTGWVDPHDGLLVLDRNGDGVINVGKELFGDQTILANGKKASNGFEALAELDSNEDGKIDADDITFSKLRIWKDSNGDGFSSPGELSTFDELDIKSINIEFTSDSALDSQGNTRTGIGSFEKKDGSTAQIAEYTFERGTTYTIPIEWLPLPNEISALPNLRGYGTAYDLQQAMARDTSGQLKSLVEQFVNASNFNSLDVLMEQILFRWTGVENVDPGSRGDNIDARKLAVLEKFFDESFFGTRGPDPRYNASVHLNESYRKMFEMTYAALMAQTHLKDLYSKLSYTWDEDKQELKTDFSAVIPDLLASLANNPEQGKQVIGQFARSLRGISSCSARCYLIFRETMIEIDPDLGWVIDSAGLPVVDGPNQGLRDWSSHIEGTDNADAIIGSPAGEWRSHGYFGHYDTFLNGLAGNDVIYGCDLPETLINERGDSILVGGGGRDWIWAGSGDDILDGGSGPDTLYGETGNDTYIFRRGSGFDVIYDADSTPGNVDTIFIGSNLKPEDITVRRWGDSLLLKIPGSFYPELGTWTYTDTLQIPYFFGLYSQFGRIERIQFMDGTVWTDTDIVREVYAPTNWVDFIYGGMEDDTLSGLGGNDWLYGMAGSDILHGDVGDDHLYGGTGDDILDGGAGNDVLDGGLDDDTYVFGRGSGQDIIEGQDIGLGTVDTIQLGEGILPSDIKVERIDDDVKLTILDTGDSIIAKNWRQGNALRASVEAIKFSDSTLWGVDFIKDMFVKGTDENDLIYGFSRSDPMEGDGGNDALYGRDGDDIIDGGSGADLLFGEKGNDTLQGGEGDDSLWGSEGDDIVDGGAGNDHSYAYSYGALGGNGNDTYLFGRGSGRDTVVDQDSLPGNIDTIRLADDISPDDVKLYRYGDDLALTIDGTDDRLTIGSWFWNDSREYQVERIQFGDGTVWDVNDIKRLVLLGTSDDDLLIGYSTADTVQGYDGNDRLYGRGQNDALDGGAGNDLLFGEAGNDTLKGAEGDDTLVGGSGNDILDGGAGKDILYGGNQYYYWSDSTGSNGNDTYLFGRGSGQDTIYDYDRTPGNLDTIQLADGIASSDVSAKRDGDDLLLSINGTTDTLTIKNCFEEGTNGWQVEQVKFADGTTWNLDAVKQFALQGTSGDDILIGFSSSDTILGIGGNDRLYGNAGDDTLNGGAGNDYLEGGSGNDVYIFGRGSGQDVVRDLDNTAGNIDTIVFEGDVAPSEVSLKRGGNDLYISISDSDDRLQLIDWFAHDANKIESLQFADGTVWDSAFMLEIANAPSDTDDYLVGTPGNDAIDGGGGNDEIWGLEGDDQLLGGDGSDTIYAGTGNNTIDGGAGDDEIIADEGRNTISVNRGGFDTVRSHFESNWTDTGTVMIKDIYSGYRSSNIGYPANVNDTLFFTARDGVHGPELWKSDGTEAGTVMVKDIYPGSNDGPKCLTNINGTLFFMADDDVHGMELWKSDGTDIGTVMVKDINPGSGSGQAWDSTLVNVSGTFYFRADDGVHGYELWKSDGTDTGTVMVRDINPASDSSPDNLINVNGTLFFSAYDSTYGTELWKSDGTEAGTVMVRDINLNTDSHPHDLTAVNGTLFFSASDDVSGTELWKSDGTEAGTLMVKDINPGADSGDAYNLTDVNGTLFFVVDDGVHGAELWRSDGTDAGTVLVKDINPGSGSSYARDLTNVNGTLYFTADDGMHGPALWKSDGTEAGTLMVRDVNPDFLTNVNGTLFFAADDGVHGTELWMSDGTFGHVYTGEKSDTIVFGPGITIDDLVVQVKIDYTHDDGNPPSLAMTSAGGTYDSAGEATNIHMELAIGIGENEGVFIHADLHTSGGGGGDAGKLAAAADDGGAPGDTSFTPFDLAIKRFVFADGSEATLEDIIARANGVIGNQEGSDYDDFLRGSVSEDRIYGLDGNDQIEALDRDDSVEGGAGNDVISLGSGNDTVSGSTGNDVIAGGHGTDYVAGDEGTNVYCFNRGDGQDYITSHSSPGEMDTLSFGASIDAQDVTGYIDGSDLVLKIHGTTDEIRQQYLDSDTGGLLEGGLSRVQFIDANGDATVYDLLGIVQALRSSLEAASPDNAVALFTDATQQFDLTGTVAFDGGDHAVAYARTDDLFAVGSDIAGGSGDDLVNGRAGNDTIDAGAGGDTIAAGAGDDIVDAGLGTDQIDAGPGDDIIRGLQGGDTAIGGSGDDTYYFNFGDGRVTIGDVAGPGEGNTIVFGEGITLEQISLVAGSDTLNLKIGTNGDEISLKVFDPQDAFGEHAIDTFRLTDGTVLSYADLLQKGFDITGTEGEDLLTGTSVEDRITGLGGDDVLAGGAGNDLLDGGSGNDTYVFNPGDGVDTIRDGAAPGAGNVIEFGMGISSADLTLAVDGNALVITVGSTGDTLRLEGFDRNNPETMPVETFRFADGTVLSSADLLGLGFTFEGTPGDDILTGTGARDTFIGHQGNDQITGGAGDDTYLYNAGDGVDTITDESTATDPNMIVFGAGITPDQVTLSHDPTNKMLILNIGTDGSAVKLTNFDSANPYGPHAVEYFQFANGQILTYSQLIDKGFDIVGTSADDTLTGTAATDRITGGDGNDTLSGGAGNDRLTGGAGDDTYLFNLGDGVDTIDDVSTADAGNSLVFGKGIAVADLDRRLTFRDNTLIIRVGTNGDEVHLTGFDPDAADYGPHAVDRFQFSDCTILNYEELVKNTFIIQGDSGDDDIRGTNVTDRLYGYEGSDKLSGGLGNDTLTGGTQNDELIGGEGSDMYVFHLGDGVDTITDASTSDAGNIIYFADATITKESVSAHLDGTTLIIEYGDQGDTILLPNFNYNTQHVVETIQFSDDSQIQLTSLLDPGTDGDDVIIGTYYEDVINAKAGNDTVTTFESNDTIDGGSGNDTIDAGVGDDLIIGGTGNDTLTGGEGQDTYVFNLGDGVDTIVDTAKLGEGNVIVFGAGITKDNISIQVDGTTMTIHYGTGDAIVLPNFDFNTQHVVETLQFSDGSSMRLPSLVDPATDGDDVILGSYFEDVIDGKGGNDTITTFESNDTVSGGTGNDTINTGAGDDLITGGAGNDTLTGGPGNDTYVFNVGDGVDTITDTASTGEGNVIRFGPGITLNDLKLSYEGTALIINFGASGDQVRLSGFDREDALGPHAVETVRFSDGTSATYAELIAKGFDLVGTSGDDTMLGTNVTDRMQGLAGNDTYLVNSVNDVVIENANEGTDTVQSSVSYTLGASVENLTLTGAEALNGAGNELANILTGNAADNVLDGGAGADTLIGGAGNDTYLVDNANDVVTENADEGVDLVQSSVSHTLAANLENLTLTGPDSINATGNELANVITGNTGNNVLDGGIGLDTMIGGLGNDTYIVDDSGDVVTENASEGVDTIQASISYTLGANLENLVLTGTEALNGTGNELDNVLTGNSAVNVLNGGEGSDTLDGGAGADTLVGGAGDDTYIVDDVDDGAIENPDEGIDTIRSSVSYSLGANLENLILIGLAGVNATGNDLMNRLAGNNADNTLTGGLGNDILEGGDGNDTYVFNRGDGLDTITDIGGADTIVFGQGITRQNITVAVDGSLAHVRIRDAQGNDTGEGFDINLSNGTPSVETMQFADGTTVKVTDFLANVVYGTDRMDFIRTGDTTDIIYAKGGSDFVWSGGGNDIIYGGSGMDWLNGEAGNDTLYGESGMDVLSGGAGDDVLDGGTDADLLMGGTGNDTYVVDSSWDVILELPNQGVDTVQSSISGSLAPSVENLTLTGNGSINGDGNHLDNVLTGNSAANRLSGEGGNDTLIGGAGNDILDGGMGSDTYVFGRGDGKDTIDDHDPVRSNTDTLAFGPDISAEQLWLSRAGNDLRIGIIGGEDKATIFNWYKGAHYQVEQFKTSDGKTLLNSQVDSLVSAMAAFAPPAAGQTTLSDDYRQPLQPVIAANWK